MIKLNELENWTYDLKPVLFDINLALNNLLILKDNRLSYFRVNYFDAYLNLSYQQHFILIIQLVKIFSNSGCHKININKLFNRFQSEGISSEILATCKKNNGFNRKDEIYKSIETFQSQIQENSELIESIIDIRDTVFAHSDPIYSELAVDIEGYTTLVTLSNNIHNTLFGEILGDHIIFHPQIVAHYNLKFMIDLLPADIKQ